MHRYRPARLIITVIVAVVSVHGADPAAPVGAGVIDGSQLVATPPASADEPDEPDEPDDRVDRAPATISDDFYPVQNDPTDCLGLLERPGCGSEGRGGWRQAAILGLILVGFGVISWRVVAGIRRNRRP